MLKRAHLVLCFGLIVLAWTMAAAQPAHEHGSAPTTKAVAVLSPLKGSGVKGVVTFEAVENGVRVVADLTGLLPGKHGFHIHEFGDLQRRRRQLRGGPLQSGGHASWHALERQEARRRHGKYRSGGGRKGPRRLRGRCHGSHGRAFDRRARGDRA